MLIGDFYLGPRQTAIFITIVEGFAADIVGMSNNDFFLFKCDRVSLKKEQTTSTLNFFLTVS